MFDLVLQPLAHLVIQTISHLGYPAVVLLMALESANVPIPSEVIMPFSGYLVSQGVFNLHHAALAGALGCLLGSAASYALGYFGGETVVRQLIRRYGKYLLIFEYELDEAEEWFRNYGEPITFAARMLPVVRTFISLPAGIAKMNFPRFATAAFLGSLGWSYLLAYAGLKLGENWHTLGSYFHKFDLLIVLTLAAAAFWYVRHKLKKHRRYQAKNRPSGSKT